MKRGLKKRNNNFKKFNMDLFNECNSENYKNPLHQNVIKLESKVKQLEYENNILTTNNKTLVKDINNLELILSFNTWKNYYNLTKLDQIYDNEIRLIENKLLTNTTEKKQSKYNLIENFIKSNFVIPGVILIMGYFAYSSKLYNGL